MRGCVFERFEDMFDGGRQKVLKMQVDCCFRDLQELQVEINHRIWSGRLRQPSQPKVHVSLPYTGTGGKRRKGRGCEMEQAGEQSVIPVQDVDMDFNINMGAQFDGTEIPMLTEEEIAAFMEEMEEELPLLDEPVDWAEVLRAERREEQECAKREVYEDEEMQLDDGDEPETVKGDHASVEDGDGERMEEDADVKEPEESIWSEESGGVDPRAMDPSAHPCDPGAGWSWHPSWGQK